MKFVRFIVRAIGFVAGFGALAIICAALAGPFGWPFELFASWPYLIAVIGVCGAIVAGICSWPRLATTVFAGSILLIALAMASPGDLTRAKAPPINPDNSHLVWGNMLSNDANAARLFERAALLDQAVLAGAETPRGGNLPSSPSRKSFQQFTDRGLIVEGCSQTGRIFKNEGSLDGQTRTRTFALRVQCKDYILYAVHLTNPLWWNDLRFKRRGEELAELATAIKLETSPVVVIGDFNVPPNALPFGRFMKTANLSSTSCGGRWLPTWRPIEFRGHFKDGNPLTGIPIDHLLTRDVEVVSCTVGPDFGSDHLPLMVELKKPRTPNAQK